MSRIDDICNGVATNPSLPLDKVNLYRAKYGLAPLDALPNGEGQHIVVARVAAAVSVPHVKTRPRNGRSKGCGKCGSKKKVEHACSATQSIH